MQILTVASAMPLLAAGLGVDVDLFRRGSVRPSPPPPQGKQRGSGHHAMFVKPRQIPRIHNRQYVTR